MKLTHSENKIERSRDFEESQYTIEATAKAFSILSDGLYANKVRAVVRELSTNALDAQVDNGNPTEPFNVHLPNEMEPFFSIRDFGTGLSHEDCMSLYTTYFRSNRTGSNESVGCMGLGSKSPFAYNDSFSVESFYNGEHKVYNAYKNEKEEPVFALLSSKETQERNGLCVSFPVNSDDNFDFEEEAKQLYSFFTVKPNITGEKIEIDSPNYLIEGDDWGIHDGDDERDYSWDACAIMGSVCYPISADIIDSEEKSIQHILRGNIDINFDIGEISVTPSRESLSYNEYTKKNILKKLNRIIGEIGEILESKLEACETLWDARLLYADLKGSDKMLNSLSGVFDTNDVLWRGEKMFEKNSTSIPVWEITGLDCQRFHKGMWRDNAQNEKDVGAIPSKKDILFYLDDLGRGAISRCKTYVESNSEKEIYLVRGSDEAIRRFLEKMGMLSSVLKNASTLEKPISGYSGGRSYARSKACIYKRSGGWDANGYWSDEEVDLEAGGIYAEIFRYNYRNKYGHDENPGRISTMLDKLKDMGYELKTPIYGFKPTLLKQKKFEKVSSKWVRLEDFVNEVLESCMVEKKWANRLKDIRAASGTLLDFKSLEKIVEQTKSENLIEQYVSKHRLLEANREAYEAAQHLASYNLFRIEHDEGYVPLDGLEERIEERYPMLDLFTLNWSSSRSIDEEDAGKISEYVDLIENTTPVLEK